MKKITWLLLSIILISAVVLSACSSPDESEETSEYANTLEMHQAEGITIGTEGTYPPYTYMGENGELTGFDVEIANEVFSRMGIEVEWVTSEWDGLIAGLDAGRWDVVVNQVGITPERQEQYSFSDPYSSSSAVIITSSNNTDINNFEDLEGKKVATSATSNYHDIAVENGAEIVVVDGFAQAIEMVETGRADATINDELTYHDYMKQQPDAQIKIAYTESDASQSGFMFKQGNEELIAEVNKTLAEMHEDGTYAEISEKYFGVDISK